jgi:hypothetical protein
MPAPLVAVIGGGGFYGRYLVADLLRFTDAEILIISRHPPPTSPRARAVACDLRDLPALTRALAGCAVVAHCAGPFDQLPLNPLRAALAVNAAYVDLAEDRAFYQAVQTLLATHPAPRPVLSGLSVCPSMEALLAELLRPLLDTFTASRTFAAPDTRKHRGPAMFYTMLTGVGRAFWQPGGAGLRQVWGWTEPEWINFPPPVGRRLTHLVLEMADLDLLPALFGMTTVEFKAGTEWVVLNRLLNLAAILRKTLGFPKWETLTPLVRGFSWLMGRMGKDEGGVIFAISGTRGGQPRAYQIAVMAQRDGGFIPSVLASLAVQRLLTGAISTAGLIPVHQWIAPEALLAELAARGLELWWQPPDVPTWQPFSVEIYQHHRGSG